MIFCVVLGNQSDWAPGNNVPTMICNSFKGYVAIQPHALADRQAGHAKSDGCPDAVEEEALEGVCEYCAV